MLVLASMTAFVAALLLAGLLYQIIGGHLDRRRFLTQGRLVTIGTKQKLFLVEKGSGGPTVVFEAGIAATHLNWFHIQEAVARFTLTASYDRCGLGWSAPCTSARTPANTAAELHQLLRAAQLPPPFVFVGHSFGCLVVRRYALEHPEDVAELLLIDPMRCEEWPPLNPAKQADVERGKKLSAIAVPIARLGLARLALQSLLCRTGRLSGKMAGAAGPAARHVLGRVTEEVHKMPREVWPIIAAHWSRPGFYRGLHSHVAAVPEIVREMCAAPPIRDIPVTVLTPEKSTPLSEDGLALIGNNIRQIVAPNSAHWIHLDQPQLVIDSIQTMLSNLTPALGCGSH